MKFYCKGKNGFTLFSNNRLFLVVILIAACAPVSTPAESLPISVTPTLTPRPIMLASTPTTIYRDAPSGIDPSIGDITYYVPWGNLAIFIRDFGYSNGLVLLGKIDGDIEALRVSGPVSATIEMIQ